MSLTLTLEQLFLLITALSSSITMITTLSHVFGKKGVKSLLSSCGISSVDEAISIVSKCLEVSNNAKNESTPKN